MLAVMCLGGASILGCARTADDDRDGDGWSQDGGDCNDLDPLVHPLASERCNAVDDDCDGSADETFDLDGDGVTPCGDDGVTGTPDDDCDDTNAEIHPGMEEDPCDFTDNDCDPSTPDDPDQDGDGYTACNDCDDADSEIHPHATEIPLDGVDQDCDTFDWCSDLDCDGWSDVVFAFQELPSRVYWGSADGHDTSNYTELDTESAYAVSIADLDGDGFLDLVFSEYCPDQCEDDPTQVFYGSGSDAFTSVEFLATGTRANAAADLDTDGYVDLVFANHYDGQDLATESVIYFNGEAGFDHASPTYIASQGATGVAAADLDGDGQMEIVFANYAAGESGDLDYSTDSFLYWGHAQGYDPEDVQLLPTRGTEGVTIADIDFDLDDDVLFANSHDPDSSPDSIAYLGDDEWSFSTSITLPSDGAYELCAANLDGDWEPEVIVANYGGDSHVLWSGDYALDDSTPLDTDGATGVAVADLDGDGERDIVLSNQHGSTSPIYWGPDFETSTSLATDRAMFVAVAGPGMDIPRSLP